jgi:AcrR family transcriptional regulator
MYDVSSPKDPTPIWARPAPGERKPAHTREQIAEAALRIADREGYDAVTMRRVASELGAGTMTLYHYVGNKDELASLMDDALMGQLLVPDDELADDWREGMAQIARQSYECFKRHPWLIEHLGDEDERGPGGPNAMRHFEQSLEVAARAGLGVFERFELVGLVDDYVFGHAMRANGIRDATAADRDEDHLAAMIAYLQAQLATGEFPHIAEIAGDDIRANFERFGEVANDEGRFERGLQRLLDGIELWLRRREAQVEG